jgi:hypothetical protein
MFFDQKLAQFFPAHTLFLVFRKWVCCGCLAAKAR